MRDGEVCHGVDVGVRSARRCGPGWKRDLARAELQTREGEAQDAGVGITNGRDGIRNVLRAVSAKIPAGIMKSAIFSIC